MSYLVDTDFARAMDAWGEATVGVLREAFVVNTSRASPEVITTDLNRSTYAACVDLESALASRPERIERHARALRTLARVLEVVADDIEEAAS